jgi:Arc/MetJ-type ribon-helix-helix transcriptional regulator
MKNLRITTRVEKPDRRKIETLIQEGKYRNLSSVMRAALREFLDNRGIVDASE